MDKEKYDKLYMDLAVRISKQSHAQRMKVGSVIVKDRRILSMGWNGMPRGFVNECEDENGQTKPEVLHSESNSILKVAESTDSTKGATMYSTHSPCMQCAMLIHQSKISRFVYQTKYRKVKGLQFLTKCGVSIKHLNT